MKPYPQRANELVTARNSALQETWAQQAFPIKSLLRMQTYRGARVVQQPAGCAGVGTLLGLALGMGTPLGTLVLGFFSPLSIAEYPDA